MKHLITALLIFFGILSIPAFSQTPTASEDSSCKESPDCNGLLPHYCVICQDGMEGGCAHWSCEENQCTIRTCDIPTRL